MKSLRETRVSVQLADRPCFLLERFTHIARTRQVRLACGERSSFRSRQMRGLRKDQELVEGIYTETADQFQSDSQTHATQVVHRFVERQASRVSQRAVCPPQLVFDNITRITQQNTPRFLFPLDHVAHHTDQLIEQVLLRSAERRLVGNLTE